MSKIIVASMKRITPPLSSIGWTFLVVMFMVVAAAISLPQTAKASTSTLYDFDTPGQLTEVFNSTGSGVANVSESTTGGIGNSGAITAPSLSTNAIFSTKEGYSLGPVGSTYTFTSYIKSVYNAGYSGLGFTGSSPATGSGGVFRPSDAIGISVHGGGFVIHNGTSDYSGGWDRNNASPITTVKATTTYDLLNNGSPDDWYKIVFSIERSAETTFDVRVEVWPVMADGSLIFPSEASSIMEVNGITNAAIQSAPLIYSFFSFSGQRVSHFDNYGVDLSGGSSVIRAGEPVVLTGDVTVVERVATAQGEVTSENGGTVAERGFVYSTEPEPTINDEKLESGSGLGTFSASTSELPVGTYYLRAYATNETGTSYGSEVQQVIAAVASSAPTITSITAGEGTATVNFTAPSSDGGATITNYEYSLDGGSNWTAFSPAVTSSPADITGLTNGVMYDVALRAVNSAGSGAASATSSVTPAATTTTTTAATTTTIAPTTTTAATTTTIATTTTTAATTTTIATTTTTLPAPVVDPSTGEPVELTQGESLVLVDGEAATPTIDVASREASVIIGETEVSVSIECTSACPDGEGLGLVIPLDATINVTTSGATAGGSLAAWIVSEPQLIGRSTISAAGQSTLSSQLPQVATGDHTLQINIDVAGGSELSVNLGISVVPSQSTSTQLPSTGGDLQAVNYLVIAIALGSLLAFARRAPSR